MTGTPEDGSATHDDQFFTGKAVKVNLTSGGTVRLTAASGYGGERMYDVTLFALTLALSDAAVEPVQVVHPDGTDATYTVNEFKGSATQSTPLDAGKTYYALHKSGVFARINTASVSSVPAG